ncbi:MAG: bifunctional metallophosphatase/5'-nucleotidase [Proteobacteria bacterium]|nr:bifunctional metallophosphatase/5'-nucleotidase [Pseudomonadota bacterium]
MLWRHYIGLLFIFFISCSSTELGKSGGTSLRKGDPQVVLLHFSDFHSHLLPSKDALGGLAKIATIIKKERAAAGGRTDVVVVASGDLVEKGSSACKATKDIACVQLLHEIGLDYSALGNNELYRGGQDLNKLVKESGVTWINENVKGLSSQAWNNHVLFKGAKSGLEFWLLSWTRTPFWDAAAAKKNSFKFTGNPTAANWADWKRLAAKAPLLWVNHLPWSQDQIFATSACENIPNKNLAFLSGDDHKAQFANFCAPLYDSAAFGETVTKLVIGSDASGKNLQTKSVDVISVNSSVEEDSETQTKINSLYAKYSPKAREVVANVSQEVTSKKLALWIAQSYLYASKGDVAIVNSGAIKSSLNPGTITWEDLTIAAPYNNDVMGLDWSKDNLEKSICQASLRKKDEDGADYGSELILAGAKLIDPGTDHCRLELPSHKKALKVIMDSYMVSRSARWLGRDVSGVSFRFGFNTEKAIEMGLKRSGGVF